MSTTTRQQRHIMVQDLADAQEGVFSLRQAYRSGLTRWDVRIEVRAGRWRRHATQCVCTHTGPLPPRAELWLAVLEAGSRAVLDGTGALIAAGLEGFTVDAIRVSVPRGTKPVQSRGSMVRQTRRLRRSDLVDTGIPRVRVPVAAVRAALWATSDRQAALILSMVVQQRLTTASQIGLALLDVRRDKRRRFLERIVLDLVSGAEALGELDFARMCRERGWPPPDRQVVRRDSRGTYVLDVRWDRYRVVVEVDGIHHLSAPQVVGDALRQNAISMSGDTVLRIPLLGLRIAPDRFLDQIAQTLADRGWTPHHPHPHVTFFVPLG